MAVTGGAALAASEVDVGGYHDQVMQATQRSLVGGVGQALRVTVVPETGSALGTFTPRVGGLGLGIARAVPRAGLTIGRNPDAGGQKSLRVGFDDVAELAGLSIGVAAKAGVTEIAEPSGETDAGLAVGGELAVSNMRFDAAVGDDAARFGLEGRRMTAGVAYGFGRLDARMSYSLVEDEEAVETSVVTVGSRLTLRSGFVVSGDVAYAEEENGDATTAGVVSFRFNF